MFSSLLYRKRSLKYAHRERKTIIKLILKRYLESVAVSDVLYFVVPYLGRGPIDYSKETDFSCC